MSTNGHRSVQLRKFLAIALLSIILLFLSYLLLVFFQVWLNSARDQARPADAIVVLGAAQWDGVPSPVLEARLEKALKLYEEGLSPIIVTTGSKQTGDRFTEAYAGLTYLLERSVPESSILVVVDGNNTFESLSATANVLTDRGIGNKVILVSDPYHALRAKEIAREVGLQAWFSPTDLSSSFSQLIRETAGTSVGRVIGFRKASTLSK
ncbi:MAG: YdcF family protein [Acidimicrobiales bacterium]